MTSKPIVRSDKDLTYHGLGFTIASLCHSGKPVMVVTIVTADSPHPPSLFFIIIMSGVMCFLRHIEVMLFFSPFY